MPSQNLTDYNDTMELQSELQEVGASQETIRAAIEEYELQIRSEV